jgi:hypothetical protein
LSCGKKVFSTRSAAKSFASRNQKENGKQRPYLCTDDPHHIEMKVWHLTSMNARDRAYYRRQQAWKEKRDPRRDELDFRPREDGLR